MSSMRLRTFFFYRSSPRLAQVGFALPTVLISSVVMLMVLLSALQLVSAYTAGLTDQYYQKLADEAAKSGINMARGCVDKDITTWATLKPNTSCAGVEEVSCPSSSLAARCGVINTAQVRSYFEVKPLEVNGKTTKILAKGSVDRRQASNSGAIYSTISTTKAFNVTQTRDPVGDRASQRYWYVGRVGSSQLDFGTTGSANPIVTPNPSGAGFGEGLTVITSATGKLLFVTNGIQAYDATNKVMPGSSGGLGASGSTAQGVISFPIKGNRYMVIGNSAGADGNNPANPGDYGILKKSIINMDLMGSNGSVGDVEAGSITSLSRSYLNGIAGTSHTIAAEPNGTENYTGQYMTAAPEVDGKGYWVVFGTPGRPYFYAILFDNNGNVKKVVRSNTPDGGPIPVCKINANPGSWRAGFGMMRFNTAYDKLVIKNGTNGCDSTDATRRLPSGYSPSYRNVGWIYLRSFSTTTGVIGNVYSQLGSQQWYAGSSCMDTNYNNAGYSVDFSPNEDYIYETTIYPGRLYRYRITGSDISSGATSIHTIGQYVGISGYYNGSFAMDANNPQGGQVRRAPNGKMYVANMASSSISVINNPDDPSANGYSTSCGTRAANFSYNSVGLGTGVASGFGLPDYVTRYVPSEIVY